MKLPRFLLLSALAAAPALASDRSPFLPPANGGRGAEGPAEAYELAGASVTDQGARICLYDRARKESRWLPVGQNSDGIEVVSYDPDTEQATVKFDGQLHTLALRKVTTGAAGLPVMTYAYSPPAAINRGPTKPIVDPSTIGKSPEVIKQEREARMLVSDLLEIGMQQRKAYEEAQRRAQGKM